MRVANKTIYDAIIFNLRNITEDLNNANKVVATGKRIINLSDDPTGLAQVLNIESTLSNISQLQRNINAGKSWLTASESALTSVQDLISDTKALCVQMASATTGAAERASAAETVQNTLEEIVSLANTEINGRYIFAGSKTDSAPFSQTGGYSGDNNPFTVKIGKNAAVEAGSDGEAVFGSLFNTLGDLKTALENNNVSDIQAAISSLDTHFDRISTKISDTGSKMIRMEIKENILKDMDIANTERLSKIEDADIPEAIIDLKAKEVAYQAALASAAKVLNVSLVDYLG